MKISFNAIKTILISATVISMVSCHSTSKKDNFLTITDQQVLPPLLSEVPVVEYSGLGIKYECESMFLKKSVVIQDNEASGNFCIRRRWLLRTRFGRIPKRSHDTLSLAWRGTWFVMCRRMFTWRKPERMVYGEVLSHAVRAAESNAKGCEPCRFGAVVS